MIARILERTGARMGLAAGLATAATATMLPVAMPTAAMATATVGADADGQRVAVPEAVVRAVAELPAEAAAIALIPQLSGTAGRLDGFLAGMDRAGLLLGADPVDQVMGLLGFNRHVDRFGAAAAAWVPRGGDADGGALVVLLPSRDPAAFIDVNFQSGDEPGVVRDAGGRRLAVRAGRHHVALVAAADASMLQRAGMGAEAARSRLMPEGPPAATGLEDRDLVLFAGGPDPVAAIAAMTAWVRNRLEATTPGSPASGIARTALEGFEPGGAGRRLLEAAGSLRVGVRFDPLGLLLDGRLDWAAPAEGEPVLTRSAIGDPLAGVPSGPLILAAGWDRGDAAATASLDRMLEILGVAFDPRWGRPEGVSLHLPRHEGGFAGGLLAGASLRLRGEAAAAAAGEAGPWIRWPGFAVDVVQAATPPEPGRWRLRRTGGGGSPGGALLAVLLAGPQGGVGRIWTRPSAVEARVGVGATEPMAAGPGGGLSEDFAVDLMRQLRRRPAVLEAYLDVAAASRWLAAAAAETPLLGPVAAIDAEVPPVGLGVDADAAGVGGSLVVPAPLAAVAWDAVLARLAAGPDAAGSTP